MAASLRMLRSAVVERRPNVDLPLDETGEAVDHSLPFGRGNFVARFVCDREHVGGQRVVALDPVGREVLQQAVAVQIGRQFFHPARPTRSASRSATAFDSCCSRQTIRIPLHVVADAVEAIAEPCAAALLPHRHAPELHRPGALPRTTASGPVAPASPGRFERERPRRLSGSTAIRSCAPPAASSETSHASELASSAAPSRPRRCRAPLLRRCRTVERATPIEGAAWSWRQRARKPASPWCCAR